MSDDLALVQTVDFFPPIVDDPFTYGEIAVANALSDIYAMGGRPLLALNIVGFPDDLPKEILVQILKGGASKAAEAEVLIVGGHTVNDHEPKYGLAVTGVVKPGSEVTNAGARAGDILVLTKPIGTGIISTAGKQQSVAPEVLDNAVLTMGVLNRAASEAMTEVGVNACVDITGFGLLGHLRQMLEASDVSARLELGAVPVLDGVWKLAEEGFVPGGTRRNLDYVEGIVEWDAAIGETAKLLMCDAQTSGGLLISVPSDKLQSLRDSLTDTGVSTAAVIGEIVAKGSFGDGRVHVSA